MQWQSAPSEPGARSGLHDTSVPPRHPSGDGRKRWERAAIDELNAALALEPGPKVSVRAADSPRAMRQMARDIEALFGRRAVFFESDSEAAPDGLCRNAGVLFINAKARQPLRHVLAHEFAHSLELSDPQLHASLKAQILAAAIDGAFPAYESRLARIYLQTNTPRLSRAEAANEFVADVIGATLCDGSTFREISKRVAPSLFRRVANAFTRWLDVVAARIRGEADSLDLNFAERNLEDVEAARSAIVDTLATLAAKRLGDVSVPGSEAVITSGLAASPIVDDMTPASGALSYLRAGHSAEGRQTAESDPLTVFHNLTSDRLIFADELGGLAVPSLAIAKTGSPPTGFGDITLIGRQSLGEPAYDNPVFDADGFTQRFPDLIWPRALAAEVASLMGSLAIADSRDDTGELYDALVRNPDRAEAVSALSRSRAGMRAFLREHGITPAADVHGGRTPPASAPWAAHSIWLEAVGALSTSGVDAINLSPNSPAWAALAGPARRSIEAFADEQLVRAPSDSDGLLREFRSLYMDEAFDGDGALTFSVGSAALSFAIRSGVAEFKRSETDAALRAQVASVSVGEFALWAEGRLAPLFPQAFIMLGRGKVPLTLDNAVAAMTSRAVRGRTKGATYSGAWTRGALSRRFKSLGQMDRARHLLGSGAELTRSVEASDAALEAFRMAALPFYEYHSAWDSFDDSMRALAAAGKARAPSDSALRATLSCHGFRNVPVEVIGLARAGLVSMRESLVEYFEAKPQRAVSLSEFAGAVIPDTATQEVRLALERAGVPFKEYQKGREEWQAQAASTFAQELHARGERVMFSRPGQANGPTFYSALTAAIEGQSQTRAAPDMWIGLINNLGQRGVKKEEVEWSGVIDWLGEQGGPVTRDALVSYLRENEVHIEDVLLTNELSGGLTAEENAEHDELSARYRAEPDDLDHGEYDRYCDLSNRLNDEGSGANEAKYGTYVTPGGHNYRELLLTLGAPPELETNARTFRQFSIMDGGEIISQGMMPMSERTRENLARHPEWVVSICDAPDPNEQRRVDAVNASRGVFVSPHFKRPNVIAHLRLNERVGDDGTRMVFVEEVQSELHQLGRKSGYAGTPRDAFTVIVAGNPSGTHASMEDALAQRERALKHFDADLIEIRPERVSEPQGSYREVHMPPDAPFKQSWPLLLMKRVIRYAAENGIDRLAWLPGHAQAERYDLSKKVATISYTLTGDGAGSVAAMPLGWESGHGGAPLLDESGVTPEALPGLIGKGVAARLLSSPPDANGTRVISGSDLEVGGEGLRAFYDVELRNEVGRYVKKWGGRVGESTLPAFWDQQAAGQCAADGGMPVRLNKALRVHSVDITPAMRAAALAGQPMFRLSGTSGVPSGFSAEDARAVLRAHLGPGVDDLEAAGIVTLVESLKDLPPQLAGRKHLATVSGLYDHVERSAFVITGGINSEDELVSTLLHEIGAHYGLQRMLGAGAYRRLVKEVEVLAETDPVISAAADTVSCLYPSLPVGGERYWNEVIAHAAEQPAALSQPWHRRLTLAVRRFLFKAGLLPQRLTNEDVAGMVAASLRRSMRDAAAPAREARMDASGITTPPGKGMSWTEFRSRLSQFAQQGTGGDLVPEAEAAGRMWRLVAVDPVSKCPTPHSAGSAAVAAIIGRNGAVLDGGAALSQAASTGTRAVLAWVACDPIPGQTETAEFKRWFGASRVVDGLGHALMVHHGTETAGFSRFERSDGQGSALGLHFTNHRLGSETYSGSKEEAVIRADADGQVGPEHNAEAGNYSVYLAMENPLEVDFGGAAGWDRVPEGLDFAGSSLNDIARLAESSGFDGVIARNLCDEGRFGDGYGWGDVTYIVFRPEQVKSATQNNGAFSQHDGRIDYRLGRTGQSLPTG